MICSVIISSFPLPEAILAHIKVGAFLAFVPKPLNISNFTNVALNSVGYIFNGSHGM